MLASPVSAAESRPPVMKPPPSPRGEPPESSGLSEQAAKSVDDAMDELAQVVEHQRTVNWNVGGKARRSPSPPPQREEPAVLQTAPAFRKLPECASALSSEAGCFRSHELTHAAVCLALPRYEREAAQALGRSLPEALPELQALHEAAITHLQLSLPASEALAAARLLQYARRALTSSWKAPEDAQWPASMGAAMLLAMEHALRGLGGSAEAIAVPALLRLCVGCGTADFCTCRTEKVEGMLVRYLALTRAFFCFEQAVNFNPTSNPN